MHSGVPYTAYWIYLVCRAQSICKLLIMSLIMIFFFILMLVSYAPCSIYF